MRLRFEGTYLVSGSHNSIINNKVGLAFYDIVACKFVFKLVEAFDVSDIGDYYINPAHLSKIDDAEVELMQHTKIYIDRPEGYDIT
jgi:hypothetical protein